MRVISLALLLCLGALVSSQEHDKNFIEQVKNSRNFTGKVVLVTGSATGIGRTTAKLFSALGAQVVVTGRKASDVSSAAKEIEEASPEKLKPLQVVADFTNTSEVDLLIEETLSHYKGLDILVNNADYFGGKTPFDSNKLLGDTDLNYQIGVRAHLQIIQKAVPALSKAKGSIVTISSDWISTPQVSFLPYEISKSSLEIVTQVLAQELGQKGIRVNAVRPGVHDSNPLSDKLLSKVRELTPLGREGHTEDIAKAVVMLASTDAQYINGAIVNVDGGMSLGLGGSVFKDVL